MAPILSLRGVGFGYGATPVLHDIGMEIATGEVVGILGPNGTGKSTLLNLTDGILAPSAGELLLRGVPLGDMGRIEVAKRIAMVSQEQHLRFPFSALQVVLMGRFPYLSRWQFESARDLDVACDALRATQCLQLADRSIHELSGGERQRVFIARALAQEPRLILLDEPTAFLDLKLKREIFRLLARLSADNGLSVVVVSHDIDLVAQYCDRVVMLKNGSIYAIGDPRQVITATNVQSVFDCPVQVDKNPATGRPRVNVA